MKSWHFEELEINSRMFIQDLLKKNKGAILERWFDLILQTYPAHSAILMKEDRDPFTNPVGSTISQEIETLFRNLFESEERESLQNSLESILKIRSVQDFSPSKAVEFIFLLKRSIGEILGDEIYREPLGKEWATVDSKIDRLALHAFDLYMKCREKVCEIRIHQAEAERRMALRLMERLAYPKTND